MPFILFYQQTIVSYEPVKRFSPVLMKVPSLHFLAGTASQRLHADGRMFAMIRFDSGQLCFSGQPPPGKEGRGEALVPPAMKETILVATAANVLATPGASSYTRAHEGMSHLTRANKTLQSYCSASHYGRRQRCG